jgi:FixJ family two-component response regulator
MNSGAERPLPRGRKRGETPSLDLLSPRERQVLQGVIRGLTNKGIGMELGISHRTVEIHRAHLMRKLNVNSVAALVAIALPLGDGQSDEPTGV